MSRLLKIHGMVDQLANHAGYSFVPEVARALEAGAASCDDPVPDRR